MKKISIFVLLILGLISCNFSENQDNKAKFDYPKQIVDGTKPTFINNFKINKELGEK